MKKRRKPRKDSPGIPLDYRSLNIKRLKVDMKFDTLRFEKMYRGEKIHSLFNDLVRKDLMNLIKRGINNDMVDNYFYKFDTLLEHIDLRLESYKLLIFRRFVRIAVMLIQDIYSTRSGRNNPQFDQRHDDAYYELMLLSQMIDKNIDLP